MAEVPSFPINSSDDHALANLELWLHENEALNRVVRVEGFPTSHTSAVIGAHRVEYDTHPVYPLLLDDRDRKIVKLTGRIAGYEYRFAGLEVDITDGTEGSYTSFPVSRIARFSIDEATSGRV